MPYYTPLSSAAVWGRDVGGHSKDGAGVERVPSRGGEAAHREAGAEREEQRVVLPVPSGGHAGGGTDRHTEVNSKQAEHSHAVHYDATASGAVRGGQSEGGSEGADEVVEPGGHQLGNGEVKGSGARQYQRIGNGHGRIGGAGGHKQGERVQRGGMERGECV